MAGHGYIVKDILTVTGSNGEEVRLVKVKNPWKLIGDPSFKGSSHGNWVGRFSQNDTKSWSEPAKTKAKAGELTSGEFFMPVEDFKRGFKYFTIAYMDEGLTNSFIEKRSSINRRLYKFNFTISDDHFPALQT